MERESQSPLRLLVIDGHESVREALLDHLSRLPLVGSVAAAGSVATALAFLREFRPDLVLYDPRTLQGNPVDIIHRLAETRCPIVVLTSSLWDEEETLCLNAGAAAVVLKGTDLGALLAALTQPGQRAGQPVPPVLRRTRRLPE
ncbi:MAG TPA: response regulator [Chloroflexota bacterium]|nr:response regulator [Chloroflexota bacterium]